MVTYLKNGELFVFLYGALVQQILRDYEDINQVNIQIEKMYSFIYILLTSIYIEVVIIWGFD